MNDNRSTVDHSLPPSALQRIDAICGRFEDAWQAGQRPCIGDYLGETEEPERDRLLRELIGLDIDYRRQLGEKPEARDYRDYASSLDKRWLERLTGASRYELAGQIGRGGMGDVLQGYDRHLRRDLAVKMLRPEFQDQPHMVRRFLREAWIGARLQHPGIVPVYELGEFPDRQPYFTMKLVRGHTLETLLKERANPAEELPGFLTIFEQVCQTVAYAHAQGVIHRDLKPANIMVGAFGEVQVMDWGLAKVLDRAQGDGTVAGRDAGASARAMESTDPGFKTQAGQAMGTYAYMPPEQAKGEVDRVDERSDVFGLGAILCEILIGRPPFTGANSSDILAKAKACDHADALARLGDWGVDTELAWLAQVCLAAEPSERPRNAGVVAEEVKAYLADVQERLRVTERERAAAQARAEEAGKTAAAERRTRRRTMWLAMAVLLLGLGGGGAGLWWKWRRAELLQFGKDNWAEFTDLLRGWKIPEAQRAMERAEGRAASGGPAQLYRQVEQMRADLSLVERLDKIRLDAATWTGNEFDYATSDRDYATVFRERGLAVEGEDPEVVAARIQGSAIKAQLVAALDGWAIATAIPARRAWLLEVARRAEPGEWSDRFRDPAVWEKRAALEQLAKDANVAELSPQLLTALGLTLKRTKASAMSLLTAAQSRHPTDFWLNLYLGNAVVNSNPDDAIGYYRAALAVRPQTSVVYNNLGNALKSKGRLDEAIKEYHKAIKLDPKMVMAQLNLGLVLVDNHDLDGAAACFRKAIDLDLKDAKAHNNLGNVLRAKGDLGGAIACYHKAINLDPKHAKAYCNLGNALRAKGDLGGAIACFHKAIDLDLRDAKAHNNLGIALRAEGDLSGSAKGF